MGHKMRFVVVFLLSLVLVGCANQRTYWAKPGASRGDFQMDQTECEAQATRDVPVRDSTIPLTNPQTSCSRIGSYVNCSTTPGTVWKSDDNENLRSRAIVVCLQRRGWQQTNVPMDLTPSTDRYKEATTSHAGSLDESEKYVVVEGGYCNISDDCVRGLYCGDNKCARGRPPKLAPKQTSADINRFTSFEGQVCSEYTKCATGLSCVNSACTK